MHKTISIDTTALESLQELNAHLYDNGCHLIFVGLNKQAQSLFKRSGFLKQLKPEQIQYNLADAINTATAMVAPTNQRTESTA